MTRYIRRRVPPPWSWRPIYPHGAPKTCLTNIHWAIRTRLTAQTSVPVGDYDPILRLYRRREPDDYLPEWDQIPDTCLWIELVDDDEETVLRIPMTSARMSGSRSTRGGWNLPLDHYEEHQK